MKTIVLLIASLLVAGNWVFADEEPSLDDPKVLEKILKDAVIVERLELLEAEEAELVYETGKRTPHTGWIKKVHINGRVAHLASIKDGKMEGMSLTWHDNGHKEVAGSYKAGKMEGPYAWWHANGQQMQALACSQVREETSLQRLRAEG